MRLYLEQLLSHVELSSVKRVSRPCYSFDGGFIKNRAGEERNCLTRIAQHVGFDSLEAYYKAKAQHSCHAMCS